MQAPSVEAVQNVFGQILYEHHIYLSFIYLSLQNAVP